MMKGKDVGKTMTKERRMTKKILAAAIALSLGAAMITGCAGANGANGANANNANGAAGTQAGAQEGKREASPDWVAKLGEEKSADQLFVVAGVGQTTAYVSMHEKNSSGEWEEIFTTPGYIGKYGLGKTKEGDGMTPVGDFHFTCAFGIADDPGCSAFTYKKVTDDDYWSGDQDYKYNEMVDINDHPDLNKDDSEHIVDYNVHYQYCMNISYNEDGTPGKGSAIFLHCIGPNKPYTGGCVAIPQDKMICALKNVKKDCVVVIDSLEKISPETWEDWGL